MDIITMLRQYRIGSYAIFDFTLAFGGIYLLSPLLTKIFRRINLEISRKSWLYFTIPISLMSHLVVGRITPMTASFLDLHGHYLLKLLVIVLFALGAKDVKVIKHHKKKSKIKKHKK